MSGVYRIVPQIDLKGFEHKLVERKIRLRNGILEEGETPQDNGRQAEAVRADQERLQGVWKLVSGAVGGRSGGVQADLRWVVTGDKMVMEMKDRWEGRITLDPLKSPKRINLVSTSPDLKERIRGVYEVRGNDLCVCLAFDDDARPEAMRSTRGTGQISLVLKRQTPAPASARVSAR